MKIDRKINTLPDNDTIKSSSEAYNLRVGIAEQLRLLDENVEEQGSLEELVARTTKLKTLAYKLKQRLNELIPNQAFAIGVEKELEKYDIPYTISDDKIYVDSATLDCISTGLNQSNKDYINNNATTPSSIEPLLVELYWQIAEQESINKFPWINVLGTVICKILLEYVHNIVLAFANAIGGMNGKVWKWCVRPGYLAKAYIIRWVNYNILYAICLLEDLPAHNDIITNKRTNQTRTLNRYRAKIGTIRDDYFYPYWNGGWTNTTGNAKSKSAYGTVNSHIGGALVKKGSCGSLNFSIDMDSVEVLSFADITASITNGVINVDTICDCVNDPGSIGATSLTNMDIDTRVAMDLLSATLESHQIPESTDDSLYNQGQAFLNEVISVTSSLESSTSTYSSMSSDAIISTFNAKALETLNTIEGSLLSFDKMLTKHMNGNFIALAKVISNNVTKYDSAFVTDVEIDKKTLITLQTKEEVLNASITTSNNKISEYSTSLETYINAGNMLLASKYEELKAKEENKLASLMSELTEIKNTISTLKDTIISKEENNLANNVNNNTPTSSEEEVIQLHTVAILDTICCIYSLALTLGMQSLKGTDFVEGTKTLNFIVNPEDSNIDEEPVYLGIKASLSMLDTLLHGIPMLISAFDATSNSASFSFKFDVDIIKILKSMVGKVSFTVIDQSLRDFKNLIEDMFNNDPASEISTLRYAISVHEQEIIDYQSAINVIMLEPQNDGTRTVIAEYNSEIELLKKLISDAEDRILELDSPANRGLNDILDLIRSGQCMSVNYTFSELIDILKKFHLQFLLFSKMLDYNPDIEVSFDLDRETKDIQLCDFFISSFNLALKIAPFLTTFCRLDDEVEQYNKVADLYTEMLDAGLLECEVRTVYYPLIEQIDSTEALPMFGDEVDISAYEDAILLNYNGVVEARRKLESGETSPLVTQFIELMKSDIDANVTTPIENIGAEIKRSS